MSPTVCCGLALAGLTQPWRALGCLGRWYSGNMPFWQVSMDSVTEWLRCWTRNPVGSARRGSNSLAVGFAPESTGTYAGARQTTEETSLAPANQGVPVGSSAHLAPCSRAHGVVVSHPLSMREALGSIPSVSNCIACRGQVPQAHCKADGELLQGCLNLTWASLCLPWHRRPRIDCVAHHAHH